MSQIVLVTGGGKGIGAAISNAFLDDGAEVIAVSRSQDTLDAFDRQVSLPDYRLHLFAVDVTREEAVQRLAADLEDQVPRIDVLINNVGGFYFDPILGHTSRQWHELVGSNLHSVYYMTSSLHPLLKRSEHGRIINIAASYASANTGLSRFGGFAALKTAVLNMSKSLSLELAADGITVNVVSPGMIDTGNYPEETIRKYEELIPAGRFGTPAEVARAVQFLADEKSSYITGAEIVVSGGWSGETPGSAGRRT